MHGVQHMMMNKIYILAAIFLISNWSSCYYDVEEELYPSIECQTQNLSYTNDIVSILEQHCYNCHSAAANFGNVTLEGYTQLKSYVNSGQLLGVIRHEDGYSPMPKNAPKLRECEIAKIVAWVEAGAPEN